MKKVICFIGILLFLRQGQAQQQQQIWVEDFDGASISFVAISLTPWFSDAVYCLPNASGSVSKSYLGLVPNRVGDSSILETPTYNLAKYGYVFLRFSHICKISPRDVAKIEYRVNMGPYPGPWITLPWDSYLGAANYRSIMGFDANSYPEWKGDDSTVLPTQSWWRDELFDVTDQVSYAQAQFRFTIRHGSVAGTQLSYGWLLENFELIASTVPQIHPPTVQLVAPFVRDTVYSTGPWKINAKAETNTDAPIETPVLKYKVTHGTTVVSDSILMTSVGGGSLWEASVPQFTAETTVAYSVTGKDTIGNATTTYSEYVIKMLSVGADNSATTYSIDMEDTVITSPTAMIPIVATIKNKGAVNLDSVRIFYTVNHSAVVEKNLHFTPSLPWDFNFQDTLGYYNPKVNGLDTISVWVSYPNGVLDSVAYDDTLVKKIYGSSDLYAKLIDYVTDTVYDVGSFNITARIYSISNNTLVDSVSLLVESVIAGTTYYDTLPMIWDAAAGLWQTNIPQTPFGSKVAYKIILTDYLDNTVILSNSFFIKLITSGGVTGNVVIGNGTVVNFQTPFNLFYCYSFSRQLYHAAEFTSDRLGGLITKLAWQYYLNSPVPWSYSHQTCYFRAVDDNVIASNAYIDPIADEATLVWQGIITTTATGWAEITLDQPFVLPPEKNLLIYWNHQNGSYYNANYYWNHTTTPTCLTVHGYEDASFAVASTSNLTYSYDRPNARFHITAFTVSDSNSVSLKSIDSPQPGVPANTQLPVVVTIRNEGLKELSSCEIYWTKNGVQQPTTCSDAIYLFDNPLLTRFTHTDTIGYYTPGTEGMDTIVVWVKLPNGQPDSAATDDTLRIKTTTCPNGIGLHRTIRIGSSPSADFPDIKTAIFHLEHCGILGKVTLQLEDGIYYESVDFSKIQANVQDTIELISLLGNAVIETNMFGIKLGDLHNVLIKDITIRLLGEGIGIQLGAGNNIEINGCRIHLDTTLGRRLFSGVSHVGILKYDENVVNNIRIMNNVIIGGYNGLVIYGGDADTYGTDWIYDSNTVLKAYYHSIFAYYIYFTSFSNNTSMPMSNSTYTATAWFGYTVQLCNAKVIQGNRVYQSYACTNPYGMFFHTLNPGMPPAEVYNNEIILTKTGTSSAADAITFHYASANIYHNSIYVSETAQSDYTLLLLNTSDTMNVKNNNLIATYSCPIFVSNNAINLDYNNYYTAGTVIGNNRGATASDLNTWKILSNQDTNSVSIFPSFLNLPKSMDIGDFQGITCPSLPSVLADINHTPRQYGITTMGAYQALPSDTEKVKVLLHHFPTEAITNQPISIDVEVINCSAIAVDSLLFEYSINGNTPIAYWWIPTAPLTTFSSTIVHLDSLIALANTTLKIWVKTINNTSNPLTDTILGYFEVNPLAEFAAPFIGDTINQLSFNVNVNIRELTGAPSIHPKMYIHTTVNEQYDLQDTITMIKNGNLWTATVPQQYYGSKVVYSLYVSDTMGNSIILMDSTYINRIPITFYQDLEVSAILIKPEIFSCDMNNRNIYVVIRTTEDQPINFSHYMVNIRMEISGYPSFDYRLTGILAGNRTDTILIYPNVDFTIGTHTLSAYLTVPIDNNSLNDTIRKTLTINPDIEISASANTDADNYTACLAMEAKVAQEVTIYNKGDIAVSNIPLVLEIYDGEFLQILEDTLKGILQVGGSQSVIFTKTYTVPKTLFYDVTVSAKLDCDVNQNNNKHLWVECADMEDIAVIAVINPNSLYDNIGDVIFLEVTLENQSLAKTVDTVVVNAIISDSVNLYATLTETITNFAPGATNCRFSSTYSVPAVSQYTIKVFINNVDSYPENDTITAIRPSYGGVADYNHTGLKLGQNIPNPAKENTRIEYSIPEDGQIIFTVYAITGQILHTEKIDAYSGKNNVEFSTANLANGIYYYSMEYNKERLMKKMIIRK